MLINSPTPGLLPMHRWKALPFVIPVGLVLSFTILLARRPIVSIHPTHMAVLWLETSGRSFERLLQAPYCYEYWGGTSRNGKNIASSRKQAALFVKELQQKKIYVRSAWYTPLISFEGPFPGGTGGTFVVCLEKKDPSLAEFGFELFKENGFHLHPRYRLYP